MTVRPALGLRLRGARFGGALALDYALPQSTSGSAGVRVAGPGASVLATALLHARVHAAIGADIHLLSGRGRGVEDVRTGRIPLWAARAELLFLPWLSRSASVAIMLACALPFERHRFVFSDGGTAYRPQSYQLLAGLRATLEWKRR
jgi:hypothetical protein